MNNDFLNNIIKKVTGNDEKLIDSFYKVSFSNFLNPFSIKNVNIAVQKIKDVLLNNNSQIYVLSDDDLSSKVSSYLFVKFFSWQKKNVITSLNEKIVKPNHKTVILIGDNVQNFSGDVVIRITQDQQPESKKEVLINGVESSDKNISFFPYSLEVLSFKIIQALFMVTNDIFNKTFVAFDLETTGAGPLDKITEIGAVKYRQGVKIDKFQTLVNPERYIPEVVIQLTNITNEMVKDAPLIQEVIPKFDRFLSDVQFIVAHNGGFDISFMSKYFKKILNKQFNFKSYDTKVLAQSIRPMSSITLEHISEDVGVVLNDAHRALADAEATGDSFLKLMILDNAGLKIFTENYLSVILLSILNTKKDFIGENRLFLITALNLISKCKVSSVKSIVSSLKNKDRFSCLKEFYKYKEIFLKMNKDDFFCGIEKKVSEMKIPAQINAVLNNTVNNNATLHNTSNVNTAFNTTANNNPALNNIEYKLSEVDAIKVDLSDLTRENISKIRDLIPFNKINYKPVFFLENVNVKYLSNKHGIIIGELQKDNITKKIILKNKFTGLISKIFFTCDIINKFKIFKTYILTEV